MKNKKYIMYLVVSILVLTIGVSYAYFKARVSGEGKSISLRSKGLYVLYSGDATLASENISPGWSVTKEFTVENQGSNNEVYNIYIEGLVNTFVTSGYLQYKITSSNGYNMSEYKDIPKSNTSTDTVLAYSVPIKSKEKQTYKVELIYKETEEDQSIDMGKILSGILGIQVGTKDPNLFTASVVVINGSSDTNSKEVYKGNDVTFTITPNDGYTLEDASISCSNGTLSNNLLTISNVQSDVTCTITLNEDEITLAQAMLRDNPTISERTDFSVVNTENTTGTLFKTNKTEDGSDVYYYSGNTTNNWVKFGKFYWRIIRSNEDGSVRVLYSGTSPDTTQGYIGTSVYNSYSGYDESSYLGYMYSIDNSSGAGTSLDGMRGNSSSSTVKTFIDNWYKDNIFTNYDKYISKNAVYCNDRSTNSFSNFMATSFGAYNRLVSKKSPSYKCGVDENNSFIESTQAVADKFSVSTDGGGNGQLTYPVALMTADEVAFAGTVYDTQFSNKFAWYSVNMSGQSITLEKAWWTMSPCRWDGPTIWSQVPGTIYSVFGSKNNTVGYLYYDTVDTENVIRPVISIDKCAYVASGDGTPDNPYTIDETSCS